MLLALLVIGNQTYLIGIVVGTVLSLLVSTLLESKILARLGWAEMSKCFGFAAASNFVTPVLAFIYLVVAIVTLKLFGIPDLINSEQNGLILISIIALFGFGIMIFRRQMLKLLQIRSDVLSWVYAFISTKITFWLVGISVYLFLQIFNK